MKNIFGKAYFLCCFRILVSNFTKTHFTTYRLFQIFQKYRNNCFKEQLLIYYIIANAYKHIPNGYNGSHGSITYIILLPTNLNLNP